MGVRLRPLLVEQKNTVPVITQFSDDDIRIHTDFRLDVSGPQIYDPGRRKAAGLVRPEQRGFLRFDIRLEIQFLCPQLRTDCLKDLLQQGYVFSD